MNIVDTPMHTRVNQCLISESKTSSTSVLGKEITDEIKREMMIKIMLPDDKLVVQFTELMANFKVVELSEMLAEDGVFEITTKHFDSVKQVTKGDFVDWLSVIVTDFRNDNPFIDRLTFDYDRCWGCSLDGYVIIFEAGNFPVVVTDAWGVVKTGVMVEARQGQISKVLFCNNFRYAKKRLK